MSNPQQPELARSRKTPAQDQDAVAAVVEGQRGTGADAPRGPVPPENQPGHHPEQEQDKPDLNAFAERLGVAEPSGNDTRPAAGGAHAQPGASPVRNVPAAAVWAGGLTAVALLVLRRRSRRRRRRS